MNFGEVRFRDCGLCGIKQVALQPVWSRYAVHAVDGGTRTWAVYTCPRCGGVTTMELTFSGNRLSNDTVHDRQEVSVVRVFPGDLESAYSVSHLPEDIAGFLASAVRVLDAGVPEAAAVQLRRTLEAATAAKGLHDPRKPLVASIQRLIDEGHVTKDFGEALSHVRKVGNLGAHYTDDRLSEEDVLRALRFTVQFLRNLFEVPGELRALADSEAKP
jgi:hypothetical protein